MRAGHLLGAIISSVLLACAEPEPAGPPPAELGKECDVESRPCVDGAFCDVVADPPHCGGTSGRCVAMPMSCAGEPDPRCGCDGEVYESACAAAQAGVSIGNSSECVAPQGTFGCGDQFCARGTQYCEYRLGGGMPDGWACLPLDCPPGSTGCDCITDPMPCSVGGPYYHEKCFLTDAGDAGLQCLRP